VRDEGGDRRSRHRSLRVGVACVHRLDAGGGEGVGGEVGELLLAARGVVPEVERRVRAREDAGLGGALEVVDERRDVRADALSGWEREGGRR
jgi:hypothetical protein